MMKTLKEQLIHWLAKGLMPIVDENNIISFDKKGRVYVNKRMLTPQELRNLKEEVKFFETSQLWEIMVNYINNDVSKKVFEKSLTITDMVVGKTILYTINVQKRLKDLVKNAKV